MENSSKLIVPPDKQYEYLTAQLRYLDDKIFRSFSAFITLATAIIGGIFYLALTPNNLSDPRLALASDMVFIGVALGSILLISNNLRSWKEHRDILSERYQNIKNVTGVVWCLSEVVACIGIWLSIVGFILVNPLNKSYESYLICAILIVSLLSWFAGMIPFLALRRRTF